MGQEGYGKWMFRNRISENNLNSEQGQTRHLASVTVMSFGFCHLILTYCQLNQLFSNSEQCCLSKDCNSQRVWLDVNGFSLDNIYSQTDLSLCDCGFLCLCSFKWSQLDGKWLFWEKTGGDENNGFRILKEASSYNIFSFLLL